jgi:Lrp/AsnC family transcriptional regulator, regulator for asnA, asnC and gidA
MLFEDSKELLILQHLRQNSRKHLKEISNTIGMPVSTVYEKLKSFKGEYIHKYTCVLNYEKLGYPVRVKILLKVKKESRDGVAKFLSGSDSINSVFRINNGYDFIAEGIFKSLNQVEAFIEELDQKNRLQKKEVYYIIENLKEEAFMANSPLDSFVHRP